MIPTEIVAQLKKATERNPDALDIRIKTSGRPVYSAQRQPDGTFTFHEGTPPPLPLGEGPGTELKKLLALVGINARPNCSCDAMAAQMNRLGPDWCLANEDKILAVMEQEAKRRKLPFIRLAAVGLIRLAAGRSR
jgi:hypothetical protein